MGVDTTPCSLYFIIIIIIIKSGICIVDEQEKMDANG